jgi:hypothetical protein
MNAKSWVMAVVAAFLGSGLLAAAAPGCSDDTAATDAGDDGVRPPKDAAAFKEPDAGPSKCPSPTPVAASDITPTWLAPPPVETACSQQDIDALKAAFSSSPSGLTLAQLRAALGTTCAGCVFTPTSVDGGPPTAWSVFVESDSGTPLNNITPSCFARLGGNACGKVRYDWVACLRSVCKAEDCGGDDEVRACQAQAMTAACVGFGPPYEAGCPNAPAMLDSCALIGSIAASCAGGLDSGIDASLP